MGFLSNLFGKKDAPLPLEPVADRADLQEFKRTCWQPVLEDGDGELTASKFSGIPYLADGESWPECPNCGNPIQLFLQLNSKDLPPESGKPWGDGLLQFFYCTNLEPSCEVDLGAWDAFAKSVVIRIVTQRDSPSRYSESPVTDVFPPKVIVGWNPAEDFPLFWTEMDAPTSFEREADELMESYPLPGEKLLGWPLWVQGREYPNCPKCRAEMRHVFQIDSYESLPYMFGDAGVGHITQCPEPRDILAFRWACS
jgi:uncharacterized protein YwqG